MYLPMQVRVASFSPTVICMKSEALIALTVAAATDEIRDVTSLPGCSSLVVDKNIAQHSQFSIQLDVSSKHGVSTNLEPVITSYEAEMLY